MSKLEIDKDKCLGCGSCELNCPEVFEINISSGKAEIKSTADLKKNKDCIDQSVKNCPTQAIYYEE